ncbi:MAG: hypothetical protein HYV29_14365 [Ignavibacteriales bacterium]|nr:hypothetical protein [Ignavibacteriales bacterium]
MKEYHDEVYSLVQAQQQALVGTQNVLPSHPSAERIFVNVPRSVQWNPVVRFVIRYPVAASFSIISLVAMMLFVMLKPVTKDQNPSYAEAKEGFLIAYNRAGEVLFKNKMFPEFDFEKSSAKYSTYSQENFFTVADVDGDGANEVLCHLGISKKYFPECNTILCFNANGSERWRYQFQRNVVAGTKMYADGFFVQYFSVKDFDRDGKCEVLALLRHIAEFPCAIILLDAATGKSKSEYWHSGWLQTIGTFQPAGSKTFKIVATGVNNGFHSAVTLLLDPRRLSGQSPSTPELQLHGIGKGTEEYYVTFPQIGPKQFISRPYNYATVVITGDKLLVYVYEELERQNHGVAVVQFDQSLRYINLSPHDNFVGFITKKRSEGYTKLSEPLEYFVHYKDSIRYWNGEKFVRDLVPANSLHPP